MLFDLSSPGRKNVIRVVYGVLALLFLIGFVGFGIGGELGGGGLIDSITGSGGSSTADQYEQQIEDAEDKLETDPQNEAALANLTQYRFLSGQVQLEYDESTGQVAGVPDDARDEFEAAVEAWNRYLDTKPQKVDVSAASNAVQSYFYLQDTGGLASAQAVLAEANPNASNYIGLVQYRYADLDFKGAEEAGELALAEAKPSQKKQVEKLLVRYREAAERYRKQLEKQPEGSAQGALENPFGGLDPAGTGGGALPPTAP